MKEVSGVLRSAYVTVLTGVITSGGSNVPVFDSLAPNGQAYPYIILSSQTENDMSTKDTFCQSCTLLIDVVTGFSGSGGRLQAEEISDQILAIVNPMATSGQLDLSPNFKVLTTVKLSGRDMVGINGSFRIFRKISRMKHEIQQLL